MEHLFVEHLSNGPLFVVLECFTPCWSSCVTHHLDYGGLIMPHNTKVARSHSTSGCVETHVGLMYGFCILPLYICLDSGLYVTLADSLCHLHT